MKLDPTTLALAKANWASACELAATCGISADDRRGGYIFTDHPVGATAWRPDKANAGWSRVRKMAGAPATVRLHDLRHFQATQLLDQGLAVSSVAKRLGHANGTTTLKVYGHGTAEADEPAAEIMGRVLDGDDDEDTEVGVQAGAPEDVDE